MDGWNYIDCTMMIMMICACKYNDSYTILHGENNYRFPLEVHLVHRGPGGKLLVIALLFKYGEASSLLEEVKSTINYSPN
jgi:hypothetical protein